MAIRDKRLPDLNESSIVNAALAITDKGGIDALSMRALAKALRCNPMSLYEYVENKDALLDLMADHAMALLPQLNLARNWRKELTRFWIAFYELFIEHPAVAYVTVQRPLADETMRCGERVLQILLRAGFDDETAVEVFIVATNFTVGAALYELGRHGSSEHPRAIRRFAKLKQAEHPNLFRLADQIIRPDGSKQFRRGLARLLGSAERDLQSMKDRQSH